MNKFTDSPGKSVVALHDIVNWLLNSRIRIKYGIDTGALYGWKYLNAQSYPYPFLYSEATGYAITSFLWIYSQWHEKIALDAAKQSANWISRNMKSYLVTAGKSKIKNFTQKANLSNQVYSFDNGMILIGLINLHKVTFDPNILSISKEMANNIIKNFFDGSKLTPLLDNSLKPILNKEKNECKEIKWSTIPGPYHSKLSLGLLELSRITDNKEYAQISNSICDFALTLQTNEGRFLTNVDSEVTYLHPQLYACEGLLYAGIVQGNDKYYNSGLKGVSWAAKQLIAETGGLPRSTVERNIEQTDCMAQLLRLLVLSSYQMVSKNYFPQLTLDNIIDTLHSRLMDFYISHGRDKGGFKYQLNLDSVCSWCTMFSMQSIWLWTKRQELQDKAWIDYYI